MLRLELWAWVSVSREAARGHQGPPWGSEHPLPLRVPPVRSPVVGISLRGQGASSSRPTWLPVSPHRGSLKKSTQSHVVIKFMKTKNKENF